MSNQATERKHELLFPTSPLSFLIITTSPIIKTSTTKNDFNDPNHHTSTKRSELEHVIGPERRRSWVISFFFLFGHFLFVLFPYHTLILRKWEE